MSALSDCDPSKDIILMCEVLEEATYVRHHKKKIAFLFSAMRHFAQALNQQGYRVHYRKLEDTQETGCFREEVRRLLPLFDIEKIIVMHPGEYRLLQEIRSWPTRLNVSVDIRPDSRFLCSTEDFSAWAQGRKSLRMEYFYREMRQKYKILMQEDQPVGGAWNYDIENRKFPDKQCQIPPTYQEKPDRITQEVLTLVAHQFKDHFGDLNPFHFAVTHAQAQQALHQFIHQRLAYFGDYQDAMLMDEPWMYHSHLSFYLNCGLLMPMACIQAAEAAYWQGRAPLNAVEGFIRQILGWREYVRGIYWLNMPSYKEKNFFSAKRPLPNFYWTGNTTMNCVRHCVMDTKKYAYAHHIQRLMVLGNFALIAGIDPRYVNEWFLVVYADAYEWVELPNVSGMVLFADGGYLASKPYAAGGNYIHKMSNYCKNCQYSVDKKEGPQACPFNYLYWNFLVRNREKLNANHRIAMLYKVYDRMSNEKKDAIHQDSEAFFRYLDQG